MKVAVRYYSRSGNTKAVAEAIAKAAGVFSTSWISKHSIDLIKKGLSQKGIPVAEEAFHVKSKPDEAQLKEAEAFAKKYV